MLNLKNTLDGYLKNVEVIGNTVQDTDNLADIRSVGDKVEGQELYNIFIQVDNGNGVSEVVEILSPVQVEKVGDVADRIICKDGVWGVEKNIKTIILDGSESWSSQNWGDTSVNHLAYKLTLLDVKDFGWDDIKATWIICDTFIPNYSIAGSEIEGITRLQANQILAIKLHKDKAPNVTEFKAYLSKNNILVKYILAEPQFIPLPHDQQVKLRTFAGQTNISFLTEIAGHIKAQVPKSLGATVNTHTEQISNLNKELDRVKKLEENTVSTIETESSFTTVDATGNGYFEDVKLEGKTLVNLAITKNINLSVQSDTPIVNTSKYDFNTTYTVIFEADKAEQNIHLQERNKDLWVRNIKTSVVAGTNIIKFTSSLSGVDGIRFGTGSSASLPITLSNIIILEGDHTNNPPEYFEGLMSVGQDVEEVSVESRNSDATQSNKKPLLYYNPTTETWEKPILREWDTIEKHSDGKYYYHKRSGEDVLNDTKNWTLLESNNSTNTIGFYTNLIGGASNLYVISDKLTTKRYESGSLDFETEQIMSGNSFSGQKGRIGIILLKSKLATHDVAGFKEYLQANPIKIVYQLAQEEVYECTNVDLMTYSGETNYIIKSGAISPKSLLKVHNNISNVVKILQEKVSLLENTFIAGLKSVLAGDMYSLATILYPEDFEQNNNIENDIMVIPE